MNYHGAPPACETAQITLASDNQGRDWELFWLGNDYQFSNQIPDRASFTRSNPGWVLADSGLCKWAGQPPARIVAQVEAPVAAPPAPVAMNAGAGGDGAMGLLLLIGIAGAGVWAWVTRDKTIDPNYHPMADAPPLPPLGELLASLRAPAPVAPMSTQAQGNSTHGIPTVEAVEFAGNSHEFEGNSQTAQTANSSGIPGVSADSQDWPPKTMGAPYDPTQPEQAGEFDTYRKHVDRDGLNPKGNDIIKLLWGCTPGRSAAYEAARKRRDQFAKRLDYYRYEEA